MARGNKDNLIPNSERSPEELKAMTRKGGKKSGETRRKKKAMREIAEYFGKMDAPPAVLANLVKNGMIQPGEVVSYDEALMLAQYGKALTGNTRAAQFVRDTSGQKPIDKVDVNDITAEQSRLDEILKQRRSRHESE